MTRPLVAVGQRAAGPEVQCRIHSCDRYQTYQKPERYSSRLGRLRK